MRIEYNYRYYLTENEYKQYHIQLKGFIKKYVATKLADVGEVIHFAQAQQRQGRYVSLYLSYEAAKYFNHVMCTHSLAKDDIYAVAYSFEKAESINSTYEHQTSYVSKHHFSFVESSEVMMTNIKRVQQAIVEGETYQVNYTARLTDNIYYPISTLYERLTQFSNGNYTALLQTDEIQVASISPELFFQKGQFNNVDNVIISKPMKGTMPRGKTEAEDQQYYKTLQTSSKDRAENVMIVDLLRNDIGEYHRVAQLRCINYFY